MAGTVVVTGATGTVGSHVASVLGDAGWRVRGVARHAGTCPGVDYVEADLRRPRTLEPALEGAAVIFLLTPLEEAMVDVAAAVIERARASGVAHVVRLSAFGADDAKPITLGRVHRAVEALVEASGLAWTHLRPNSFMQNYLTYFSAAIRATGRFELPQGDGRVSVVDVRDIAAVTRHVVAAPAHRGRAYELTGPESLANADIAGCLSAATGRTVSYEDVSEGHARASLEQFGTPPWLADVLMELYAYSREGLAARCSTDVERVTGRPPTAFRQFAGDYAARFSPGT